MNALESFFDGKPGSREVFEAVRRRVEQLGPFDVEVRAQISFGVNRKFAWFWLYNVTKNNPSGTLHMMLRLDERVEDAHVRRVEQISRNRWNHQVVLRALKDAESAWLGPLLEQAYRLGSRG